MPPTMLDVFLKVCPMWKGKRLHVRSSLLNTADAIDSISVCIKHCMRWCDFSETRWTKVGQCSRLLLKSLLVGVDSIVDIAAADSAVSKWHLNGFIKKSSHSVRYD